MTKPSQSSRCCPKCGTEFLPGDAGFCPRCALAAALNSGADDTSAKTLALDDLPLPGNAAPDKTLVLLEKGAWRAAPPPGRKVAFIGDYELLEVIGRGGMGVVYQARQRSLNRMVALKMLLGGIHAGDEFKKRFQQEAELAARLQHPNIVQIYEVGEHEGQPYFSMEYVEGSDLARLTGGRPLAARQAAEYVKTVAGAVDYAHREGILHRDLKPSNILIGSDHRPRITDFGLARLIEANRNLTLSGVVLGTPGYLPPEQAAASREQVGVGSDVYALGAVLYHLLTGRPPFLSESIADTLRQVLESDPLPLRQLNPEVPRDLETISLKCLAKQPSHRYASAWELALDLDCWLEGKPIKARPVSVPERVTKWTLRHPAVAVITALSGMLMAVGVFVASGTQGQPRPAGEERFHVTATPSADNVALTEARRTAPQQAGLNESTKASTNDPHNTPNPVPAAVARKDPPAEQPGERNRAPVAAKVPDNAGLRVDGQSASGAIPDSGILNSPPAVGPDISEINAGPKTPGLTRDARAFNNTSDYAIRNARGPRFEAGPAEIAGSPGAGGFSVGDPNRIHQTVKHKAASGFPSGRELQGMARQATETAFGENLLPVGGAVRAKKLD